jgi:hypothetical protein
MPVAKPDKDLIEVKRFAKPSCLWHFLILFSSERRKKGKKESRKLEPANHPEIVPSCRTRSGIQNRLTRWIPAKSMPE